MRNHPPPDGNKRCAYICLREFLARHGVAWRRPPNDEAAEMIERLAASEVSEAEFAGWVGAHVESAAAVPREG